MSEEHSSHGCDAPTQVSNVETIPVSELLARVQEAADRKLRFVTATCFDSGNDYELYYHFAEGPALTHLRVVVTKGTTVPSISGIYMCAFLVENEIKELFGVPIADIVIDYKGRLLLTEGGPVTPMLKQPVSRAA